MSKKSEVENVTAISKKVKAENAITIKQAAKILECSAQLVHKMVYDGRLKKWEYNNGKKYVCKVEVSEYKAKNEIQTRNRKRTVLDPNDPSTFGNNLNRRIKFEVELTLYDYLLMQDLLDAANEGKEVKPTVPEYLAEVVLKQTEKTREKTAARGVKLKIAS